jgi:hypothetical protein
MSGYGVALIYRKIVAVPAGHVGSLKPPPIRRNSSDRAAGVHPATLFLSSRIWRPEVTY